MSVCAVLLSMLVDAAPVETSPPPSAEGDAAPLRSFFVFAAGGVSLAQLLAPDTSMPLGVGVEYRFNRYVSAVLHGAWVLNATTHRTALTRDFGILPTALPTRMVARVATELTGTLAAFSPHPETWLLESKVSLFLAANFYDSGSVQARPHLAARVSLRLVVLGRLGVELGWMSGAELPVVSSDRSQQAFTLRFESDLRVGVTF